MKLSLCMTPDTFDRPRETSRLWGLKMVWKRDLMVVVEMMVVVEVEVWCGGGYRAIWWQEGDRD